LQRLGEYRGHVGPGVISPAQAWVGTTSLSCSTTLHALRTDQRAVGFPRSHSTNSQPSWPSHAEGEGQAKVQPNLVQLRRPTETNATVGKSLSIARTQHLEKPRTPPMAYVEEVIPEEPIQVPPESLLFTVPDDLQFPSLNTMSTSTQDAMEGTTCIVEEEFPGEFLHMDSNVSTQDTDKKLGKRQRRSRQSLAPAGGHGHRAGGPPSLGASTAHCNP
jgi:hypothetical protein